MNTADELGLKTYDDKRTIDIEVVSDGTAIGTGVRDRTTGRWLDGVVRVVFEATEGGGYTRATVEFERVALKYEGDATATVGRIIEVPA